MDEARVAPESKSLPGLPTFSAGALETEAPTAPSLLSGSMHASASLVRSSLDRSDAAIERLGLECLPLRSVAAERILQAIESDVRGADRKAAVGMPKRVKNEPGFILHTHPWSESSLLLDVLTLHYGRVFLIAKGAKRASSQLRGLLTTFTPLVFAWSGKNEAKVLLRAEWLGAWSPLTGEALLSGFYVNELLLRMTVREDPLPGLFEAYAATLEVLCQKGRKIETEESNDFRENEERHAMRLQAALRRFEAFLLDCSGWPLTVTGPEDATHYIVLDGRLEGLPSGVDPKSIVSGWRVFTRREVEGVLKEAYSPEDYAEEAVGVGVAVAAECRTPDLAPSTVESGESLADFSVAAIDEADAAFVLKVDAEEALRFEKAEQALCDCRRTLRAARDILREIIRFHLGGKSLRTREVLGALNRL